MRILSGLGGIIGIQDGEIGQHTVEGGQITLVELAFHGLLLTIYVSPHSCLQIPGLGGRGNDALTTVSGVPFGDDQSVCLHSP